MSTKIKKSRTFFYFQELKKKFLKQPKLEQFFSAGTSKGDDGLRASYNISLLIAKSGKPHTIGEELILPAISEVIQTVMHRLPAFVTNKISLSNNTIQRRTDEMAQDVEYSLSEYLKTSYFSLQIDESTLPGNEVLLLGYVQFIKNESIGQELLFAKNLQTDTKGESLFLALKEFFEEKELPLHNILTIATDGVPAMIGRHKGFVAYLKKELPNIIAIHYVIHRQHLVARNLSERLNNSLSYVIQTINKIKSNSLNSRLFIQLCQENDEEFNGLRLHTEVRWLSNGACLNRFYNLHNFVLDFLNRDNDLRQKLLESRTGVAYLTDWFNKFNEMNLKLQGDDLNLIKTKSVLSGFVSKILFFKQNLGRKEVSRFPNLAALHPCDEEILCYCQHLNLLYADFNQRFDDIFKMKIPDWVLDPFADISTEDSVELQEELLEIQSDDELKFKFKSGYQEFWLQKDMPSKYPETWSIVQKLLLPFPSSYLVERGFSVVTNLLTEKRNRLQITERGDLRLILTKIKPRIDKLVESHQIHPSH